MGDPIAHVIILDAGSSGTRVHVYDYVEVTGNVPTLDLNTAPRQTMKIKPGLSAVAEQFASMSQGMMDREVQENLAPLISFAEKFVPEKLRFRTAIVLKATAGLRSVDQDLRDRVIDSVRLALRRSGFLFEDRWARVIPGVEEGGLAWVTANYLSGVLTSSSVGETQGVVEMGGGSTQVTFSVEDSVYNSLDPTVRFLFRDMRGHEHKVYALSYIGYGQDYALRRYRESILGSTDPCRYGGSFEECQGRIKSVLFESQSGRNPDIVPGVSMPSDSPVSHVLQPSLRGEFIATENFFYIRNDLKSACDENIMDLASAAVVGSSVCADEFGRFGALDPDNRGCFAFAYQSTFLKQIGAVGSHTPTVRREIDGNELDWAVGAAIVHFVDHAGMLKMLHGGVWRPHQRERTSSSDIMEQPIQPFRGFLLVLIAFAALAYILYVREPKKRITPPAKSKKKRSGMLS